MGAVMAIILMSLWRRYDGVMVTLLRHGKPSPGQLTPP